MPTISRFFGLTIRIYFEDHRPAHFHAYYAEYAAAISIETLAILQGSLPPRAYRMILEWAADHRQELLANCSRAEAHQPLRQIEPLR